MEQFSAPNDEKYVYLWEKDISKIKRFDSLAIFHKLFNELQWY